MQEKAKETTCCKARHLCRFLDLSLRKNYPLTSLVKNSFDKDATLSCLPDLIVPILGTYY